MSQSNEFFNYGLTHVFNLDLWVLGLFVVSAFFPILLYKKYSLTFKLTLFFLMGHFISSIYFILDKESFSYSVFEVLAYGIVILSCINNFLFDLLPNRYTFRYVLIYIFGFIYGLSITYFTYNTEATEELFYYILLYNLGAEIGILILIFFCIVVVFLLKFLRNNDRKEVVFTLSFFTLLVSLNIFIEKLYLVLNY